MHIQNRKALNRVSRDGKGYIDFGFAKYDHNRHGRQGFPEAIYAPSKTKEQLLKFAKEFLRNHPKNPVLFTRLEPAIARAIVKLDKKRIVYNPAGKILALYSSANHKSQITNHKSPVVAVITAGTGDIPVAEEAAFTCEALGSKVSRLYDVGVAGIHRLLSNSEVLKQARCAIVCAGMEGALPSVVGGLTSCPVIGVPTSIGYGVALGGRVALDAMLSSCASNVCVVNIDNGFSAGVIANLIVKKSE